MKLRKFLLGVPERDLPIQDSLRLAGQAAAGATQELVLFTAHAPVQIDGIKLAFDTALTGVNTNTVTISFLQYRGGVAVSGAVVNVPFVAGTTSPAKTQSDVATLAGLSTLLSNIFTLAKGDVLTVKLVQAGTGLAVPAGRVEVNYAYTGGMRY